MTVRLETRDLTRRGVPALVRAELHALADRVRRALTRSNRRAVAESPRGPEASADELLQANEQLVISALRAQRVAEVTVKTLDKVSQSAESRAREDLRVRHALVNQNAELEARVVARTADLILARDEALEAVRTKEAFLSSMSHEIRTPMAGMLGALELLARGELTQSQAAYLRVATTSGTALMAILNEVLDFAKLGAGHVRVVREPIDLEVIARSVMMLFSAAAESAAIDLRLSLEPALQPQRIGDSLHLRQVLMNLVGNAIKFAPGGRVTLSVRRDAELTGNHVHFEVRDTGPGIDEAHQARIFEPFEQSDHPAHPGRPGRPGRRSAGGSGLGLAISRRLVQEMGGELRVDSSLGHGARFHFDLALPAVEAVVPSAPKAAPRSVEPLEGCVLVVEDNPVNQMIATDMLKSLGLTVVAADDGVGALEHLRDAAYAAVLMDCQMPRMDGYEATRLWRETERADGRMRTPVIAMTANAFSSDVAHCLSAGMDAHLAKPFTSEELRAMLSRWLPHSRWLASPAFRRNRGREEAPSESRSRRCGRPHRRSSAVRTPKRPKAARWQRLCLRTQPGPGCPKASRLRTRHRFCSLANRWHPSSKLH